MNTKMEWRKAGMAVGLLCVGMFAYEGNAQDKQESDPTAGNVVGMAFVEVKAGGFMRESSQVTLTKPFWMAKTEVTQRQYQQLMSSNPSRFKGDDLPVETVSWIDAMEFCRKLSEVERQAGRLPEGYEYTLPTEAQWEYACRAGTTGDHAGNLDAMGWYKSNAGEKTHPVGAKQPNAWGLYDMHGNVWEWCLDFYDSGFYGKTTGVDPVNTGSGSLPVIRGGCWDDGASNCRSADRDWYNPSVSYDIFGFRACLVRK
jgi:formylglycine-generating enzyme required for sulfatase activity